MLRAFAGLIAVTLVLLVATYLRNGRWMPWTAYRATPGWIRAGIYFCLCYLLSYASGGMELIVNAPVATAEQLGDASWWAFTALAVGFICIAYGVVWVRYTVRFDRPLTPGWSTLFGVLWGTSSGQLFLAVWLIALKTDVPEWGAWLMAWLVLGAWQPNFHSIYWDHYIAPEHDTRMTQRIKALGCHIPNLALTLTYLAVHDNYLIFVALQTLACVAAATGMRFPKPGYVGSPLDFAHRSTGRIPRCLGYLPTPDPTSDPYTPFYKGWKAKVPV